MGESTGDDPFRPFRPRRGRQVATVAGIIAAVGFTVGGITVPLSSWQIVDRVMFAGIGYAIAALFWRYATIRALPTRDGLTVRNLILTRVVDWPQVVGIQFGGGTPWVHLDLSNGETLAVMAIQRADGRTGKAEASRLAALIQALGTAPEPHS